MADYAGSLSMGLAPYDGPLAVARAPAVRRIEALESTSTSCVNAPGSRSSHAGDADENRATISAGRARMRARTAMIFVDHHAHDPSTIRSDVRGDDRGDHQPRRGEG